MPKRAMICHKMPSYMKHLSKIELGLFSFSLCLTWTLFHDTLCKISYKSVNKTYSDRGCGLLLADDPDLLRPRNRPTIWSQFKPIDITMYDLMYDDWLWRKGQIKKGIKSNISWITICERLTSSLIIQGVQFRIY